MHISKLLLVICSLLAFTGTAQVTSRTNYREFKLDNPQMLAKLKPFLQEQRREVYICTSRIEKDQIEYALQPVGNLSELIERPTSLYISVENSLIFVVSGLEPMVDQKRYFEDVIRPLVKGRVVNDVFPNGKINLDAVPSTYDAQGLVITMKQGTIDIRWVNN
jgi:hypothetical protein